MPSQTASTSISLPMHVFIDQDRVILGDPVDDADKLIDIVIVDRDLHTLSAKNVGRANENRITQLVLLPSFASSAVNTVCPCRSRNLALLQDLIEELSVLCRVNVLCSSSKDRNAHLHQGLGQLDRGLSTELDHSSVRFLDIDDALHIFRGQRLKIQLICDIEVGTYGLRVIVDDDRLIAFFCKCPGAVNGTEVELDTLSDTDRTGAENQYLLRLLVSSTSFSLPKQE